MVGESENSEGPLAECYQVAGLNGYNKIAAAG